MPGSRTQLSPAADGHGPEFDPLTGLPGRAALHERFHSAAATAQHEGRRLGLLFLDLDGFKPAGDDLGHRAGDAALRHVARCLDACVRGYDTVSRAGGDAFVILLTDLAMPADAARVAQILLDSLRTPERIGEHGAGLSASIGISVYPDDGGDLDELIRRAEGAMGRARRRGPGGWGFPGEEASPEHPGPAPAPAPGGVVLQAVSLAQERARQGQLQEANEQLLLAALAAQHLQSVAEHALDDQTALLARVAHELRNPLTPIGIAASLIDAAHVDELPQLRALIERQVDHISRLVGDLLDVSRGQAGKLRLQWSVLELGDLVGEALEACRPAIDARRQRVALDLPGKPLRVQGDHLRLVQVLANLFDNASKYTPAEGAITVAAHEAGTDVEIRVCDTGIGIRADALATVFDPFVQESHATRFNGTGLGIGLTVVRELVEAHGGHVEAFSAGEGQGSQFVVTLPLHDGSAPDNSR